MNPLRIRYKINKIRLMINGVFFYKVIIKLKLFFFLIFSSVFKMKLTISSLTVFIFYIPK